MNSDTIYSYGLIFVLILLLIGYNIIKYFREWRFIDKIPGPRTIPIFGNILDLGFDPQNNLNILMKWWYDHGCDKYRLWFFNKPFIIISDPKDLQEVLCNNELLDKSFCMMWQAQSLVKVLLQQKLPNGVNFVKL